MRTFDELWISSIIGVLIFTSPLLLLKIHSDYKKIAELSKIGVVFAFILFSLLYGYSEYCSVHKVGFCT